VYFTLSKVAWWIVTPLHALLLLLIIGVILLWAKRTRAGTGLVTLTVLLIVLIGATPIPEWTVRPLEQWHPVTKLTDPPDGIILLGGGQNVELTEAYERPQLNDRAETMSEFLALGRRFPKAKMVFAGGSGDLVTHALSEADVMQRFAAQQGFDSHRLLLESKSRNTHENALYARELANPKPGERWLLITSAFHMPRSVAVFQKLQWDVLPYPTDYHVLPTGVDWRLNVLARFRLFHLGLHEWIGFLVYWVTGRA
jgi:uncharacterized SAM-binding protein YcdF (DUF218 family)